jgi:hypothetical protein
MKMKQAQVIEFTIEEATDALITKARQLDKSLPTKIEPLCLQIVDNKVRLTAAIPVNIGPVGTA